MNEMKISTRLQEKFLHPAGHLPQIKRPSGGAWFLSALCLTAAVFFTGCGGTKAEEISTDSIEYQVILPEDYETSGLEYPVVYCLPDDGLSMSGSSTDEVGIVNLLQQEMADGRAAEMILVCPAFQEGTDLHAVMESLVKEVDSGYRTLADQQYRAVMGTGTGGYLAYAIGLTEDRAESAMDPIKKSQLFSAVVSIRGDFSSEENPWLETYGEAEHLLNKLRTSEPELFEQVYTYLDAPVEDEWTNMEGSTSDLGAWFIEQKTSSASHEFTLRPGKYDEAFLAESVSRIADRLTTWMGSQPGTPGQDGMSGQGGANGQPGQGTGDAAILSDAERTTIDGDYQKIDLSDAWYFQYVGEKKSLDVKNLNPEEYGEWPLVLPGVSNWTKGYGNIDDKTVKAPGADYFDYFIIGNGYYVKEFTVPAEFDSTDLILSIGYIDDRCEVFLNGERIGATGMDENGQSTGETTWAEYSCFEVDPDLLVRGGTNTLVVRAWNDTPYGAGGWYEGPVGLFSRTAFENQDGVPSNEENPRFFEASCESAYAASALGQTGTVENQYLVYLPEGYEESDRYYPTVYLLHQFNSDHTSYKTDHVDQLLDAGAAAGAFDEMIVIIPNSSEESWWKGDWEKMLTEELIPLVDSRYRTIQDARYRLTAGCSMGGQGAYSVALHNPEYFSGVVSFFGAFSYGGEDSPNAIAQKETAEYLNYFAHYFICGNQDVYGFGVPAMELNRIFSEKNVEHRFFIENGGHDSEFYVPYFEDAFSYVRGQMYQSDEGIDELLRAEVAVDAENGLLVDVTLETLTGIENYFNVIPESSYTENSEQGLSIPLTVSVIQDGKTAAVQTERNVIIDQNNKNVSVQFDFSGKVDTSREYKVVCCAYPFDRKVELTAEKEIIFDGKE